MLRACRHDNVKAVKFLVVTVGAPAGGVELPSPPYMDEKFFTVTIINWQLSSHVRELF